MECDIDDMVMTHEGELVKVIEIRGDVLLVDNNVNEYQIDKSDVMEAFG